MVLRGRFVPKHVMMRLEIVNGFFLDLCRLVWDGWFLTVCSFRRIFTCENTVIILCMVRRFRMWKYFKLHVYGCIHYLFKYDKRMWYRIFVMFPGKKSHVGHIWRETKSSRKLSAIHHETSSAYASINLMNINPCLTMAVTVLFKEYVNLNFVLIQSWNLHFCHT